MSVVWQLLDDGKSKLEALSSQKLTLNSDAISIFFSRSYVIH